MNTGRKSLIAVNLLFVAGVSMTWAWYHCKSSTQQKLYHFQIVTNPPGWRYQPVQVPYQVQKALASTNFFNGFYLGTTGKRITVFVGQWNEEDTGELSVVGHTPDVCWPGQGWIPVSIGQPNKIQISISGNYIPFESRAFRNPDFFHDELTIWCTIVNGKIYNGYDFLLEKSLSEEDLHIHATKSSRRVGLGYFWSAVRYQNVASSDKQFIRLSMKVDSSWEHQSKDLITFANNWLTLSYTNPQTVKSE